ncbi:hypothetical protein B0I35DRAFT_154977 [Stachybotrys elegans]|uniref:Cell wall protein PhiA n=1 Tax=Stachybotrys elegans TaxID=80388 RepID=A0A8K0S9B9_9HYPO|nr:hypothetical protein B0I35DRAFT_154977 [Stachybotrys elegans]
MKVLLFTPLLAGVAAAQAFRLVAENACSPIHNGYFNAALSNIYINLEQNDALCPSVNNPSTVIMSIIGDGLYFSSSRNPVQTVWVDRSAAGQGKIGYLTQDHWIPPGAEFNGWSLDDSGSLTFDGASFIACPNGLNGAWTVWLNVGIAQPGGNVGCVPVLGREAVTYLPYASCTYTVNGTLWEIE